MGEKDGMNTNRPIDWKEEIKYLVVGHWKIFWRLFCHCGWPRHQWLEGGALRSTWQQKSKSWEKHQIFKNTQKNKNKNISKYSSFQIFCFQVLLTWEGFLCTHPQPRLRRRGFSPLSPEPFGLSFLSIRDLLNLPETRIWDTLKSKNQCFFTH